MYLNRRGSILSVNSSKQIPKALSPISAGEPAESTEDYDLLDLNEFITKGKEGFVAYPVTGDSMVNTILPGYIVFVDPYEQPKNGDIVASSVNGRTNIKIFEKKESGLFLVSANKKYEPQQIKETDDFHVLGVVKSHLAVY